MATDNIIDPRSLSFEEILADFTEYVESRPDFASWNNFLISGVGQTELELMSGLGAMLNFQALFQLREHVFDTSILKRSVWLKALDLGYPVNRKQGARFRIQLRLQANRDAIDWVKENPIATIGGVEVSLLQDTTVDGEDWYEVVAGTWNQRSFQMTEDRFSIYLVNGVNIDNDTPDRTRSNSDGVEFFPAGNQTNRLTINIDPENPGSETVLTLVRYSDLLFQQDGLDATRVLARTHPDGVLLVFGDDTIGYKLKSSDVALFEYISVGDDVEVDGLGVEDVQIKSQFINQESPELAIEVLDIEVLNLGTEEDSLDKIKRLASGYFASRRKPVTGDDYANILASNPSLRDASWQKNPEESCILELVYLDSRERIYSDSEKEQLLEYIEPYRYVGTKIEIVDPRKIGVLVEFVIVIDPKTNATRVRTEASTILQSYMRILGRTFRPGELVRDISRITGVERVYPVSPVSDKDIDFDQYFRLENAVFSITSDPNQINQVTPTDNSFVVPWDQSLAYSYGDQVYAPTDTEHHTILEERAGKRARLIKTQTSEGAAWNSSNWDFFDLRFWSNLTSYSSGGANNPPDRVYGVGSFNNQSIQGKVLECRATHTSNVLSEDLANNRWAIVEEG